MWKYGTPLALTIIKRHLLIVLRTQRDRNHEDANTSKKMSKYFTLLPVMWLGE